MTNSSQFGSTYGGQTVSNWKGSGYDFLYMPGQADTVGGPSQFGGDTVLWGPHSGFNNGPPFDLLDGVSAIQAAPTPEPSSLALLGTGVACVAGVLRRCLRLA